MRVPKIADMPMGFGGILAVFGLVDDDLPDIIPDDLDFNDPEATAAAFPRVLAKLGG